MTAGDVVALSSVEQVLRAIACGRQISVEAYTLRPNVERELERAARRGAAVSVRLEAHPVGDAKGGFAALNERLAARLRAAGADAALGHPVHSKTIAVDGTLYLDEKNWDSGDLVLRAAGTDAKQIPNDKRDALDAEAGLLRNARASDGAIVESESFGSFNVVESALSGLATAGAAPRLIVSDRELQRDPRERAVLTRLAAEGVAVRVSRDSEKLAAAGNSVWLGSANATSPFGRGAMSDWGICTADDRIARAVRERLERTWSAARPFAAH